MVSAIQIQHLLKLNFTYLYCSSYVVIDSNTTFVKVKYDTTVYNSRGVYDSNTTFVKVKSKVDISSTSLSTFKYNIC